METFDFATVNAQCMHAHRHWAERDDNHKRSAHLYRPPPNSVGVVSCRVRQLDVTMKFSNGRNTISCPSFIDCGGSYEMEHRLHHLRPLVHAHLLKIYGFSNNGITGGLRFFRFEKPDGSYFSYLEEETETVRHYLSTSVALRVIVFPLGCSPETLWDTI